MIVIKHYIQYMGKIYPKRYACVTMPHAKLYIHTCIYVWPIERKLKQSTLLHTSVVSMGLDIYNAIATSPNLCL